MQDSQDYVTAEQTRALMEFAKEYPKFDGKVLIKFLFHSSRRISEVVKPLGPTPSDINFHDKIIKFNILKKRKARVEFIPLDDDMLQALKDYIQRYNIRSVDFLFPICLDRSYKMINEVALRAAAKYPELFTIDKTPRGVTRVRIGRGFIKNHTFRHASIIHIFKTLEEQGKQTEGILTANQNAAHASWEQTLEYARKFGRTRFKENINDVFRLNPV